MSPLFPKELTLENETYIHGQVSFWVPTYRPGRRTHPALLCWTRQWEHHRDKAGGVERAGACCEQALPSRREGRKNRASFSPFFIPKSPRAISPCRGEVFLEAALPAMGGAGGREDAVPSPTCFILFLAPITT